MKNDSSEVSQLKTLARETLAVARDNIDRGHWRTGYNRLYYACFYAARALLVQHGHTPQTHSGVKTQFSNHFIRAGILDEELSSFYGRLMEARLDSDYEASFDPDPAQLRAWVPKAEAFIDRIVDLLDNPSS